MLFNTELPISTAYIVASLVPGTGFALLVAWHGSRPCPASRLRREMFNQSMRHRRSCFRKACSALDDRAAVLQRRQTSTFSTVRALADPHSTPMLFVLQGLGRAQCLGASSACRPGCDNFDGLSDLDSQVLPKEITWLFQEHHPPPRPRLVLCIRLLLTPIPRRRWVSLAILRMS